MQPSDEPSAGVPPELYGLTDEEVAERVAEGRVNARADVKTKSVGQIMRDHTFTFFNAVNLCLAVLVMITGQYRNMLFMGVVLSNLVIGIVQELRAKRMVDRLTILTASSWGISSLSWKCSVCRKHAARTLFILSYLL